MPILDILIFRGTGGVRNVEHPYHAEPALVRAGHVGIAGVIPDTIIGFHPMPEATEAPGGELPLIGALAQHQAQPGRLQDDTAIFERAAELAAETNGRTTVYTYSVEVSEETLTTIREWYNEKREAPYNFPKIDGQQFVEDEYNCAMFITFFGLPLPLLTGKNQRIN